MTGIQFATDAKDRRVAIQIDLKKHGARLEEFWDGLLARVVRRIMRSRRYLRLFHQFAYGRLEFGTLFEQARDLVSLRCFDAAPRHRAAGFPENREAVAQSLSAISDRLLNSFAVRHASGNFRILHQIAAALVF